MTILPIFTRDLRPGPHSYRFRKDRLVAGAVAGLILLVLAGVDRWSDGVNVARFLKGVPMAGIMPYFLLMVGLSLGAKLLAVERREGTLSLLLLTRLTGYDILLGKLLMALVVELNTFLAVVPTMVLPLLVAGYKWKEIWYVVLGSVNVVFFGLALGLFSAVFFDEEKAMSWCLLFVLPFMALATPFGVFLPSGPIREFLAMLQPFNPGEALAHVQTITGGFRSYTFWTPLLVSHLLAWGLLGVGGMFLARTCRERAGRDAGPRSKKQWRLWNPQNRSTAFRTRLLNRNPYLWLTSRHQWATVQVWLYMGMAALFWGWLAWLSFVVRGLNIAIVLAIAVAASWMVQFLVSLPAEASRRLVEDRQSGALEMLLCTPLPVERIVRGQWLALGRRYLPPLTLAMLLSLVLMVAGYVTYGFGGMLDPEDRGLWLSAWLAGIGLLPLALTALCWVSMRRSLVTRNVGEASGIAVLQVVGLPCLALPVISMLLHSLFGWNPGWSWNATLFAAGFAAAQVGFAWRARAIFYRDLRQAAASRYFQPTSVADTGLWSRKWWRLGQAGGLATS